MSNHQYFAQLDDDDVVIQVCVVTRAFIDENPERYPGRWVETFTDVPNKTYAGIGFTYDEATHDFVPASPPYPPDPEIL
jgi:hypothetical protein